MKRRSNQSGFTLVETAVTLAIVSIGIGASLTVLERGTAHGHGATADAVARDDARRPASKIAELLLESGTSFIDTTMRLVDRSSSLEYESDRFMIFGMKQCSSPLCGFHTRSDLTQDVARLRCGTVFARYGTAMTATAGKVLPYSTTTCPYDGSDLWSTASMDVLRFFRARGRAGDFRADASGFPQWNVLSFLVPVAESDGPCNLVLYEIDLVEIPVWGETTFSSGWNTWPTATPTLVNLLDFGGDGTTNGVLDGTVPRTAALSDAAYEYFAVTQINGQPTLVWTKELNTDRRTYPSRVFELTINLADGKATLNVEHRLSSSVYWTLSGTILIPTQVIASGITEFAVSTKDSNPRDETTNVGGVDADRVVRITLGATEIWRVAGQVKWQDHVESQTVFPRNG